MKKVTQMFLLGFTLIAGQAQANMYGCGSLGLKTGDELKTVIARATDPVSLEILQSQGISPVQIQQLRQARGMRWIEELIREDYPELDLSNDTVFIRAVSKATGRFDIPFFRTVVIHGTAFDEVETGHGGGDWEEASYFYTGTTDLASFSTVDGSCEDGNGK